MARRSLPLDRAQNLWEEGLWPGIRRGSENPLATYLKRLGVQKHSGVHNLKSSWVLCANLYFPFPEGRIMIAICSPRSSGSMLPVR